jgi:hypothetical protein
MRRRPISRRRIAALLALLAAGAVLAGIVLGGGSPARPSPGGDSAASGAATVERRDLVETDTEAGTLGYEAAQTVYDRLSGTITWLPSLGQAIRPGGTLFMVDGRPVVLMDGSTPAFRELAPGVAGGRDVLQLNRNLAALGYDPAPLEIDDEWQAATTAGVDALQAGLGEQRTGRLAFGDVVFLPGEQLVASVQATLGGDGAGSGGGGQSAADHAPSTGTMDYASVQTPPPAAASQAPEANSQAPAANPQRSNRKLESLIEQLQRQVAALRARDAGGPTAGTPAGAGTLPRSSTPGTTISGGAGAGETPTGGASPTAVLQTTSTRLVVTVELDAGKRGEATVGEHVGVELPDGTTASGTVTSVSRVAKTSSGTSGGGGSGDGGSSGGGGGGGGGGATIPVTIALHGSRTGAGLDQATVSVNFARERADGVLSVPVTALLATGGANYAVQEAAAPHRLLAVTTGLFAAGYVQISGPGIRAGLSVTDSQA